MHFQTNRCLSEFSTFGIGGPIRYCAAVATAQEMQEAFSFIRRENIPYLILGKGSNCLFSDRRFDGVVLLNKIDFCTWKEDAVFVGAGYSFSLLGSQSARRGLSGLEFASGIPASVGGAIAMNAGAHGRETHNAVRVIEYLHLDGAMREYQREELSFQYRTSPFQTMQGAILSARFDLTPSREARRTQLLYIDKRNRTQPLREKSAGCVFRNPQPHIAAGALIEQCGLKNLQIGGAKVSPIHANFIVNEGNATACDVLALIEKIQTIVYAKTRIRLELEIKIFS